ncbi:MAG: metallophosphoesterase [Methanocella sp.]
MIIVISDVHLGYTKSNRESFREFLDRCMPLDIEHFVILGDLIDFWRANNARAIIDNQDILGLIGRLNARNVYYIPGNHDYYVHKLAERYKDFYPFKVSKRLRLVDGGQTFNFAHGYELEVLSNLEPMTVDTYERWSERMCFSERITGGIATRIWDMVEKRNEDGDKAMFMRKPPHERTGIDKVRDLATSKGAYMVLGMKPGDNLVYGHTHRPFINEEKTVANTGSWVDEGPADRPRNTYVIIEDGQMRLKIFDKEHFP